MKISRPGCLAPTSTIGKIKNYLLVFTSVSIMHTQTVKCVYYQIMLLTRDFLNTIHHSQFGLNISFTGYLAPYERINYLVDCTAVCIISVEAVTAIKQWVRSKP